MSEPGDERTERSAQAGIPLTREVEDPSAVSARPAQGREPCWQAPHCDRPIAEIDGEHQHVGDKGEPLGKLRWTLGLGNREIFHTARPWPSLEGQQQ